LPLFCTKSLIPKIIALMPTIEALMQSGFDRLSHAPTFVSSKRKQLILNNLIKNLKQLKSCNK
jgi:hypothetical protein